MAFTGERISATAAIASILNSYPFSVGVFRELLQNSDDAKATKQIFVLDTRHHPTDTLYHPNLASTQGPALLAFNDGLFSEEDWEAVQTIYESSKVTDTSKIGKYGIGFRSSYHVTDNPEILSGSSLAIFDPHRLFTTSGGATVDLADYHRLYQDQLSGFEFFLSQISSTGRFPGTVIRLPLRTTAGPAGPLASQQSQIKNVIVEPAEMRQLLNDFIIEELNIVLLFLANIVSIEIYEISKDGTNCLACAKLNKAMPDFYTESEMAARSYTCTVSLTTKSTKTTDWRVFHVLTPESYSASLLSKRMKQDVTTVLTKQKLSSNVALAMPLSNVEIRSRSGRLFTYLPLPLHTNFPCHVHGLFALTPDRQHLRNSEETGLVAGSTDAIVVEWNRLLFEHFIPNAWANFMSVLVKQDHFESVFDLWPPSQPIAQAGDSSYWQSLPAHLLTAVTTQNLPIWPTAGDLSRFLELKDVMMASGLDSSQTIGSLIKAGLPICIAPVHVRELLIATDVNYTPLSPVETHRFLLANVNQFSQVCSNPDDIDRILIYLLSTMDVTNIIGLPLLRLSNGQYTLLDHASSHEKHTLLNKGDFALFGSLDDSAIALHQLPSSVAQVLETMGPDVLNISPLTCTRAIEYLHLALGLFGLVDPAAQVSPKAMKWLINFWEWAGTREDRLLLYGLLQDLRTLPTAGNVLVIPKAGVFTHPNVPGGLRSVLEDLGLFFLPTKFTIAARRLLLEQELIRSPVIAHDILDEITTIPNSLESCAADLLRAHISSCLPGSCFHNGALNAKQQFALLNLPIYPIIVPPEMQADVYNARRELGRIPSKAKVFCIINMPIVPIIDGRVFVDDCHNLLGYAMPSGEDIELLGADRVLSIAIDHLAEQPKHLMRGFIEYMEKNQDVMTPRLLDQLSKTAFVTVGDGSHQAAPLYVVDPESELVSILPDVDERIPCTSEEDDAAVIIGLRHLHLLVDRLNQDIVRERINFIASTSNSGELAEKLLQLIVQSRFDCFQSTQHMAVCWLPTTKGNCEPGACHHHDAHPQEWFDQVLPIVKVSRTSASLRLALGWNKPIPLDVLKKQFQRVINLGLYPEIVSLIDEFGKRMKVLEESDLIELQTLTCDLGWVPISNRRIVKTSRAIFSQPATLPHGFHVIPALLADKASSKGFLQAMGCRETPSSSALISELHILEGESCTAQTTDHVLAILQLLVLNCDFAPPMHTSVLIPDSQNILRSWDSLYYDDLGYRSALVPLPEDRFLAHFKLNRELAQQLKIPLLSVSELKALDEEDEDMGENLITRISSVLRQYTVEQAFGELVSNAADAGAEDFDILVDEKLFFSSEILSPSLAEFQRLPALVIHNNASFTPEDFRGIRRIGTGGKEGRSDTLGQFGLGALSFYHFTECAMILSGDKMLFLNPSKGHLSFNGRASVLLPISHMKRVHMDHLSSFHGLFGYSRDSEYYSGTLIRLPLRSKRQVVGGGLSNKVWSAEDLQILVTGHFWQVGREALLFTELKKIRAAHRDSQGSISNTWTVECHRARDTNHLLRITGTDPSGRAVTDMWQIVSQRTMHCDLPTEFEPLVIKHRIREPIITGIAANLTPTTPNVSRDAQSKIFSGLPLPHLTSLPAHLNGSFILAEDRRSIRFDGDGNINPESRYNRWLFTELMPSVYGALLEALLSRKEYVNKQWRFWPSARSKTDPITSVFVDGFYSEHLMKTPRQICLSIAGTFLRPCDAIMTVEDSPGVLNILELCKPHEVVDFPSRIRRGLKSQISMMEPDFLRKTILSNAARISDWYHRHKLRPIDFKQVIDFLLPGVPGTLIGLPLIPLADGNVGVFSRATSSAVAYYVWQEALSPKSRVGSSQRELFLFPLSRFLDPHFQPQTVLYQCLNISQLTGSTLPVLVQEHLTRVPKHSATQNEKNWIKSFWAQFHTMNARAHDVAEFPLVATSQDGVYISLGKCLERGVFVLEDSEPEWLTATLGKLGALIVQQSAYPAHVQNYLTERSKSIGIEFSTVLPFLRTSLQVGDGRLSKAEFRALASWARENVHKTPVQSITDARLLPIWPTLGLNGQRLTHVNAISAFMLPSQITLHVITPFLKNTQNLVGYSVRLQHTLNVKPMTFGVFRDLLAIPSHLSQDNTASYKELLRVLISNYHTDRRDVLVPNARGFMVPSTTLYAHSEPIFREAFSTRPQKLIRHDFQHLESGLSQFGLCAAKTFESFTACVTAIHEDSDGSDRLRRAGLLFEWYNNTLPIQAAGSGSSWKQLHRLRFIPRHEVRQHALELLSTTYTVELPEVVSPAEILRPEHEPVAWTQRALFLVSPSERLLISDLSLGVPSVREVVEHLRVLATRVAQDLPMNRYVLSGLTKTYGWLEAHKDNPELRVIEEFRAEPIFLNVDNPGTGWQWSCANKMFFDIAESDDLFEPVRKFLAPFENLLLRAGVKIIKNPAAPKLKVSSPETQLAAMRLRFNTMRLEGKLADVIFIANDGGEFRAHRFFLAAQSEYLTDLFCNSFEEAQPASAEEPIESNVPQCSSVALKCTLDYLYTGTLPSVDDEDSEPLLEIARLSNYWDLPDLNAAVQLQLTNHVSLSSHRYLLNEAMELEAKILQEFCETFINDNLHTIIEVDV